MGTDRAGALRLAGAARVGHLATVRPAGSPHVVPITFAIEEPTLFTVVDEKPKSTRQLQRLANVRANPVVSVLVDHYEEAWENLWWVRLDGHAEVVETGDLHRRAVKALANKYQQYREAPPSGPAIVVSILEVRWWAPAR